MNLEKWLTLYQVTVIKKLQYWLIKSGQKLQIEYDDFMSAVDMPMSIELGENLRDQMKNIFKALEKLGIKFE